MVAPRGEEQMTRKRGTGGALPPAQTEHIVEVAGQIVPAGPGELNIGRNESNGMSADSIAIVGTRTADSHSTAAGWYPSPVFVLLVEDNEDDAVLFRRMLLDMPNPTTSYVVAWARTLAEALDHLAGQASAVDVVMVDLALPDSWGLDAVTRILEAAPNLPVIVLSGHDEEAPAYEAVQRGAQDYLVKGQVSPLAAARSIGFAIERKKLQRRLEFDADLLRAEHERLAELVTHADVSMTLMDEHGRLVLVNDCWVERNHIPREAAIGRRFDEIEGYRIAPSVQSRIDTVLATGEDYRFHEWYYEDANHPDGIYADGSIVPVRDPDGRVAGVRTISVDVTDKVRARQAVEEQKGLVEAQRALLETILDTAPVGLACFDCEMRPVSANAEYERICGLQSEQAYSGDGSALLPAAWADRRHYRRVLAGEAVDLKEVGVAGLTGMGSRYFDVYLRPVEARAGEVSGVVIAAVDITDRLETERQKESFLTLASHELRTPLTSIRGYTDLALRSAQGQGDRRLSRMLEVIKTQTEHLSRIVTDLLDTSRIGGDVLPLRRTRFDLVNLVEEVTGNMSIANPGIALMAGVPPRPLRVHADRHLVEEVLVNLIENAIKYAHLDRRIEVTLKAGEREAVASVRDYGVGIPPGQLDRVFDRFYRASNAGSKPRNGLGLGLYIARSIVERHGGRMWVESAEEEGSTFYFSLPGVEEGE
jgi:PAS domain S-box-containing protein